MSCRVSRSRLVPLVLLAFPAVLAVGACSEDNQLPVLVTQDVTTDEDVPIEIKVLEGASDPDGDTLFVTHADAEGHGAEVIHSSIVRVTPMPNFHGTIRVSYNVSDGHSFVLGRALLTVRSVNDAPTAGSFDKNVHGPTLLALSGYDVDGDALTYEIVAGPAHGTLTGNPPMIQYTPDVGFVGDDAVTYRVSDGTLASDPATIHLHTRDGSAPTAFANTLFGAEDQPLGFSLLANDLDGDPLTFTIVTPPQHGTLSGTAPHLVYTPAPDFNSTDSLEFSVSDGVLSSGIAIVTINVAPVNDAPVAMPQTVAATEDIASSITLQASDVDGDTLTFQVQSPPSHGTLSGGSGAARTYTPAPNYHGPDSFTFIASEVNFGGLRSALAKVTIDVASVEDPPVAAPVSVSLNEDTSAGSVAIA